MEVNVTIPEKVKTQKVTCFIVAPPDKVIQVQVSSDEGLQSYDIDISTLWTAATTTQKNTIKAFFKKVGALALDAKNEADSVDVTDTDLSGDIFED